MSKHLLNSVILIMLLIIISGGGFYFIQERYNADIMALKKEYRTNRERYNKLLEDKKALPRKMTQLENLREELENFPIMLMNKENIHNVYAYLEKYDNTGAFFDFRYKINGIAEKSEVIEAQYTLDGEGDYRKLAGFINYVEYSPPLFFIDELAFTQSQDAKEGKINLKFRGIFSKNSPPGLTNNIFTVATHRSNLIDYNPFNALILWKLPPNDRGLPDVRYNKLLALTENTAYFKSINGEVNSVKIGDKVYLGRLNSIDTEKGIAVFFMNYGGIYKKLIRSINETPQNVK